MEKLDNIKRKIEEKALHARLMAVGTAIIFGGPATATTPTNSGAAAVQGLGLDTMIGQFAQAIRTLVSENGTALALVILPILAWYFIRNQLRGSV